MPWKTDDVDRFKKGLTDKQKRQWVAIANDALERCQKAGGAVDECEARAIRQANGVVGESANMEIEPLQIDFIPLVEKAVRRDGTISVKVIQPGWGSSGYYSREVLERDAPKAFPPGTHMHWNHPTLTEQQERPERDLRDLAAVLVSEPTWREDKKTGPGMYADAAVFSGYKNAVDELAEHIGVSILGSGITAQGEAEGKTGPIVQEITRGQAVDFVTRPGAGGQIVSIFESVKGGQPLPDIAAIKQPRELGRSPSADYETEVDMDELKEVQAELEEAKNNLTDTQRQLAERDEALAVLREILILGEARDFVAGKLAESELPDVTKARLARQLSANPPVSEGKLDEETLGERIQEAITEAEAEIAHLMGYTGRITGSGNGSTIASAAPTLEESQKVIAEAMAELGYGGRNGQ